MRERFHHDSRVNALDKQQRSARVAEIVQAHRRQFGSLEQLMESMRDVWPAGERASLAWEYRVSFTVRGSFEPIADALAGHHVVNLASHELTLEETFLTCYEDQPQEPRK